jgi:hypothetical protein
VRERENKILGILPTPCNIYENHELLRPPPQDAYIKVAAKRKRADLTTR